MDPNNKLKYMLHGNCNDILYILAFDGDIDPEVKFSLYEELKSILDAINGAPTIDGTNFKGFRERTIELKTKIDNLKSSRESE